MSENIETRLFLEQFSALPIEQKVEEMNNFHGWCPGGYKRGGVEEGTIRELENPKRAKKLIAEIDEILEEQKINPQDIIRLRDERKKIELHELIEPVFVELVQRGWDPSQLSQ